MIINRINCLFEKFRNTAKSRGYLFVASLAAGATKNYYFTMLPAKYIIIWRGLMNDKLKRYIVEFGIGLDIHGQDVGKAAQKAVQDAVSKSCLCGLSEVLGLSLKEFNEEVFIKVTVAVSHPERVDAEAVAKCLPVGKVTVQAVKGGLTVPGLYLPAFGDLDDSIEAAIAAVEVCVKPK